MAQERLQAESQARRDFLAGARGLEKSGYEIVFVAAKGGEEQRMREILAAERGSKGSSRASCTAR